MIKNKSKISEVLSKLLFERRMKATELAREIDIPQPTLHRIISGKSPNPHSSTVEPIAEFFNVTVDQLKGNIPIGETLPPSKQTVTQIPLYNWDDLSARSTNAQPTHYVIGSHDTSNEAFAVNMNDSSMEPQFPRGSILILDPNKPANDRSYALIQLSEEGVFIFRQLLVDANHQFLKPLNPDLNAFPMRLLGEEDSVIGVLIEARHLYNQSN